jgi:hypothetical protein
MRRGVRNELHGRPPPSVSGQQHKLLHEIGLLLLHLQRHSQTLTPIPALSVSVSLSLPPPSFLFFLIDVSSSPNSALVLPFDELQIELQTCRPHRSSFGGYRNRVSNPFGGPPTCPSTSANKFYRPLGLQFRYETENSIFSGTVPLLVGLSYF